MHSLTTVRSKLGTSSGCSCREALQFIGIVGGGGQQAIGEGQLVEDDPNNPEVLSRRSGDHVSAIQLELTMERWGRSLDKAVASITSELAAMGNHLEKKLDAIDQSTQFMDRQLATRIDGNVGRLDRLEKELEEVSSRGSRNFKLALTGVIFPTITGAIVFVLDKVF